jgi:hypothetical protein
MLTASELAGGHFEDDRLASAVTSFSYADVLAGHIRFVDEQVAYLLSYRLQASDGSLTSASLTAQARRDLFLAPGTPPGQTGNTGDEALGKPEQLNTNEAGQAAQEGSTTGDSALEAGQAAALILRGGPDRASGEAPPPPATDLMGERRMVLTPYMRLPERGESRSVMRALTDTGAHTVMQETFQLDAGLAARLAALNNELGHDLDILRALWMQQESSHRQVVAATVAVSTGLSVGYVIWLLRGGALLGSLLSAMPAWQMVDPLPVLTSDRRRDTDKVSQDEQPLENLFDQSKPHAEKAAIKAASSKDQGTAAENRQATTPVA